MDIHVSVIVPVFEQWAMIPRLLDCLKAQSYPRELFDVLLVDNGSSEIVLPNQVEPNVRVLHCEKKGAYAARNYGVAHARGDWLVFTDADCLPAVDWISEIICVGKVEASRKFFLAGRVDSVTEEDQPSACEIYDLVRGIPQSHYVNRGYAATANLAVPRALIQEVGGFNEQLFSGGDADFCRRATHKGFRIAYADSAVVGHRTRASWRAIATKARRVKGGQLTFKSRRHKLWIYIRTILSPGITSIRFFRSRQFPLRYRFIASFVYLRVWGVELLELLRVSSGGEPERR
ncbi:glycosyltransferase family 2 protein [Microbulbifer halophilus]|uniref:glycosyltransferase family 2 protein n=1 Tax=Microbulbifer halophilus TaxID=453963 RepID=UPI002243C689|nr:glycosyltransferase [Microbulbifer halophilus]